ncbi:MAG: pyruvate dehydrogenase complex dihydrolipoamide acetyltransferase [Planctomycetes bacterium]|nr:pyruvate dehydrogenase complex dihydrolipoamide acetyltransferase [Planctomycetota bacterium]
MAIIIEMPKLSDTMSEGKILSWKKREGEPVQAGEIIAEVESDKANMEMEAYDSGFVRKVLVPEGGSAPVGAPIAIVTEGADEDIAQVVAGLSARAPPALRPGVSAPAAVQRNPATPAHSATSAALARPAVPGPSAVPGRPAASAPPARPGADGRGRGRLLASPLAFRMAAELGIALSEVQGTGPAGRIVKRDVLKAASERAEKAERPEAPPRPAAPAPGAAPAGAPFAPPALEPLPPQAFEDLPVSAMRRTIAQRLAESKAQAPHFYVTVEVDAKGLVRARDELNAVPGVNVTYNDLVVKAAALALVRHPALNASWQGDAVRRYRSVDIGVAVALPDGLVTPVVRACHLKGLAAISREIRELAERARQRKLAPGEYSGGTFTVSNLGMFGVRHFTAILNPPEACILAVGAVEEVPVVEGGAVVPGRRMALTLSSDHRVVDGAQAAQFLRDLKQMLESPTSLAL